MEFTKSTGTVIGATAQMKTKIAGHAIICLIFPTDTGSHYSLYEGLDKWLRCQASVLEVHGSNPAMTWLKITSLLSLPYRC